MSNYEKKYEKKYQLPKEVTSPVYMSKMVSVSELKKIGAGHDGIVFRYHNLALKLLKYDIALRKEKQLMTFEKEVYFQNELDLKRIVQPIDPLFDQDGIFVGYIMMYIDDLSKKPSDPNYKSPGDFTYGNLLESSYELKDDFDSLTSKKVEAKDINTGSYIFSDQFMNLCDMDKYSKLDSDKGIDDRNTKMLNFAIAKFLYLQMCEQINPSSYERKTLKRWVKKSANARDFFQRMEREGVEDSCPIKEFAKQKAIRLLK